MRRRVGVAGLKDAKKAQENFKNVGKAMEEQHLEHVSC
jgi:hypothetical protein